MRLGLGSNEISDMKGNVCRKKERKRMIEKEVVGCD